MARVWQDYGNAAIRELYPRTRDGVDYKWGRLVGTNPASLLFDNTAYPINLTNVQSIATYRMALDDSTVMPKPPPPPWPGAETGAPGGGGSGGGGGGTVTPGAPISFYAATAPIAGADANDTSTGTIGANIEPLVPGKIKAVRWYCGNAAAAPDGKVAVWTRDGTLIKAVAFTGKTGIGWRTVDVDVTINQCASYTVGVWHKLGSDSKSHYWAVANQFASVPKFINNGTINVVRMPAGDGMGSRGYAGQNNVFTQPSASDIIFPSSDFNDGGYAVDIEFVTLIPSEPATPTAPPSGWNDVRFSSNVAVGSANCGYLAPYRDQMVFQNLDFVNSTSGEPLVANTASAKFINCRFKGREGPRIAGAGTYEYIGCYIECTSASDSDHADGLQVFPGGTARTVRIVGTTIHLTTDLGFGNNAGAFFSDNAMCDIFIKDSKLDGYGGSGGGLRIDNVTAGTSIGATKLQMENVVLYSYVFNGTAPLWTGVITKWINVTEGSTGAPIANPFP